MSGLHPFPATSQHLKQISTCKRQRLKQRRVTFIGAPFCEGQNLDGADLGPCSIREAGLQRAAELLGWDWTDEGDIDFATHFHTLGLASKSDLNSHHHNVQVYRSWLQSGMRENFSTWVRRQKGSEAGPLRRTETHADVENCGTNEASPKEGKVKVVNARLIGCGVKLIHDSVTRALSSGSFVLTVGGDHSIASGTISALHMRYPDLGVIWVDAHADANTPCTSPSMHYHGMPAAHLLGWFESSLEGFEWMNAGCLDESRLAYIGLRDIDREEARMLKESNVHAYTMRDVDKHGIAKVIEMAMQAIDPNCNRPLHLSLDIDAVDPHFAPGTGTCSRGGLTYREIHYVCEELAITERLVSMDLVEVNPALDPPPVESKMHGDDPNIATSSPTVQLAVELALSALGKTIL